MCTIPALVGSGDHQGACTGGANLKNFSLLQGRIVGTTDEHGWTRLNADKRRGPWWLGNTTSSIDWSSRFIVRVMQGSHAEAWTQSYTTSSVNWSTRFIVRISYGPHAEAWTPGDTPSSVNWSSRFIVQILQKKNTAATTTTPRRDSSSSRHQSRSGYNHGMRGSRGKKFLSPYSLTHHHHQYIL